MLNSLTTPIATTTAGVGKSLQLRNLVKRYGNFAAVDDVSCDLQAGEFLTLLGPSGSGKSTTLMMVAGFETPNEGTISVDGHPVTSLTARERNFGVVFQGYALFPHVSALHNVEFPLRMRGVDRATRRKLAMEMLEKVGLSSMAHRRPRELSGGQQQRVALARALVFKPNALLLDEPLGALDKNMREKMQYEIKELQKTLGITVLFVTHDQEEAMSMSDRIAVMNEGKIVQIGTPDDVYRRPQTKFVANFLGETNMLDGLIASTGAESAKLALPGNEGGSAMFMQQPSAYVSGNKATMTVRPEKIRFLAAGEQADWQLTGKVVQHTFLGRQLRSVVDIGGTTFNVISQDGPVSSAINRGDEVMIGWSSTDAQLLLG